MMQTKAKAFWQKCSAVFIAITLTALAWLGTVDVPAKQATQDALVRATIAYTVARTMNGVISVMQGTEIAMQPAGMGLTLTPGEILDPINDLIERFSWVMLLCMVSLGLQNIILLIGESVQVQIFITIFASLWLIYRLLPQQWSYQFPAALQKSIVYGFVFFVLLRFAVPVLSLTEEHLFQNFLQDSYQESSQVLQQTSEITELQSDKSLSAISSPQIDKHWLDDFRDALNSAADTLDIKQKFVDVQDNISHAIDHIIRLIVLFLIQTVLFPLLFLWIWVKLWRYLNAQIAC